MPWRRIIPAAFLGPLLLWAASWDAVPYYLWTVGIFTAVAVAELYRLLLQHGYRPLWPLGGALAVLLATDAGLTEWHLASHALIVGTFATLLWLAFRPHGDGTLLDWALTPVPPLYVGGL